MQDLNRYVAIAEEFPNDASGKVKAGGLMHDRKVSRIVTPGTLIDENFMDPFTNNYVLAIYIEELLKDSLFHVADSSDHSNASKVGLAWLDLSTGHFFTQLTNLKALPSFLARIGPREIVLDESLQGSKLHGILAVLAEDQHLITYIRQSNVKDISAWVPMLESPIPTTSIDSTLR